MKFTLSVLTAVVALSGASARAQGGKIIRIPTPTNARCINARTDEVTISLRRIITQKTGGFFTQDNKAGITVLSTLNADGTSPAKTPSVNLVDIKTEPKGQVSLPLEYPIASQLALKQGNLITKNMQLDLYLNKTRGANTFGTVLTTAGDILGKLPIPANPYTTVTNQFLQFANQTIQNESKDAGARLFASITLQFNNRDEPNIQTCLDNDHQPTGAIAVVSETGAHGANPLPVANLNKNYCWRYTTDTNYEIQYVAKPASGICTSLPAGAAWAELPNDYVMLIVSAATVLPPLPITLKKDGSLATTLDLNDPSTLGALMETEDLKRKRLQDLQESVKLCKAMDIPVALCGVQ